MISKEGAKVEHKSMIEYHLEEDELYPLANFDGQPEFAISDLGNFNHDEDSDFKGLAFTTQMAPNELAPKLPDHTLIY